MKGGHLTFLRTNTVIYVKLKNSPAKHFTVKCPYFYVQIYAYCSVYERKHGSANLNDKTSPSYEKLSRFLTVTFKIAVPK